MFLRKATMISTSYIKSRLFFITGVTLFLILSSCLSLPRSSRDFFQRNYSNPKVKNAELVLMLSKTALTFLSNYMLNKSHNKKELSHQSYKQVRTILLIRDTVSLIADFCKFLRHPEYGIASGAASLIDFQNNWSLSPEGMKKLPDQFTKEALVGELFLGLFVANQEVDSYKKLVFEKAVDAVALSVRLTNYDDSTLKRVALGAVLFYALSALLSCDRAAHLEMQLNLIYNDFHDNRDQALNNYLTLKSIRGGSIDRFIFSPALARELKEIDDELLIQYSRTARDLHERLMEAEHARDFSEERRAILNNQIQELSQNLSNVRTRLNQEIVEVNNLQQHIREERARANQSANYLAAEQNRTNQLQQQINQLEQNLQAEQNYENQLQQQINHLEQNLQAEQNRSLQFQQQINQLQNARPARVLPTIRIGDAGDREGRLSFIVHRPSPYPEVTRDSPALPMTTNEVADLRQTADGDPARDIIVLACNHLLEALDSQGQEICPYCREPRRPEDEAVIHLNPHSDQPQQTQWRIAR